ncbi:MAG: hypothetical protein ACKVUS_05395 [Saprospiraceae bacterium]
MTELLIKLPEHQVPFFMALLKRLQFVKVEKIDGEKISKEQFLSDFEGALNDAQKHLQGKIRLPKIEEILDEV